MPSNTRLLILSLVVLFITGSALAQVAGTTSSLSGMVTTDGKPLPGVTVTVSSPSLQGTRTAVTGEGGGYTFPSLPPGLYVVTFELEGMQKITKKVTLSLATPAHADTDMKVIAVSEATRPDAGS